MHESIRRHKFPISQIAVRLEKLFTKKRNLESKKNIVEPMFRAETSDTANLLKPFPEFFANLEPKFQDNKNSWTEEVTDPDGKKYIASAKIFSPNKRSTGIYDPRKPNFIYHHFAGITTSPEDHIKLLRIMAPDLNRYNIIVVTAHGHSKNAEKVTSNPMSRTFATMRDIQGTIAASVALVDNLAQLNSRNSVYLGISMGGIVEYWHRILGDHHFSKSLIIVAHPQADKIFTSSPFSGMFDPSEIEKFKTQFAKAFDMGKITTDLKNKFKDVKLYLGTKDSIVSKKIARDMAKRLGIEDVSEYPFDHLTIALAGLDILRSFKKELKIQFEN